METVCIDVTNQNIPIIFVLENERQIINAGTTIYAMPASERNRVNEYQRYSDEYDIRFIFDDNIPMVNFYSVPQMDIFAMDSLGGYFGTVGDVTDLGSDFPICYIDCEKVCYLIA